MSWLLFTLQPHSFLIPTVIQHGPYWMFYSFISCSCSFSVLLLFVPNLFLFSEPVKLFFTFPMTDKWDRDSRRQLVVMKKKRQYEVPPHPTGVPLEHRAELPVIHSRFPLSSLTLKKKPSVMSTDNSGEKFPWTWQWLGRQWRDWWAEKPVARGHFWPHLLALPPPGSRTSWNT